MRILYEQRQFPILQNRVYETEKAAIDCQKGDIKIVEDQSTGLIYNAAFDSELMGYDATYNNEQALSPAFRSHLEQVAGLVEKFLGKQELVEVGCGKGFFLEMMLARGVDIIGFDRTYDGDNPRVVKDYFEPGSIGRPSKRLILRHVLEHIPDPYSFLCQLRDANGGGGLVYIEVPCFDWILRKQAWFDIFYEHVNYFRMTDFEKMFGRISQQGRFFGDQYLYTIADLASLREPVFTKEDAVSFPEDFLGSLGTNGLQESPVCVWGGASKGVIFSLIRKRVGLPVDIVIDVNPAKQGKFLPATGLKVSSPEQALSELPGDALIYVMNSNYLDEIKTMTKNQFHYIGIDQ
jgi:hypothetical protein